MRDLKKDERSQVIIKENHILKKFKEINYYSLSIHIYLDIPS